MNDTSNQVPYRVMQIIAIANQLLSTGSTGASTNEQIAAAFALDDMQYLPPGYSAVAAWERIEDLQRYVHRIHNDYMHLIAPW